MSSADPVEISSFCEDFFAVEKSERLTYVVNELQRIDRAGLPVLRTVLSCSIDEAQTLATELLHENADKDGQEILEGRAWRLRLVEGAVPPSTDPQGRPLPVEKRGKVLSVKVGNKGGNLKETAEGKEWMQHSGPIRTSKVRADRDLYNLVEVTRTPKAYSLRHAILILRKWGVGCTPEPRRMEHIDKKDRMSEMIVVQENWLVEEVLEAREPVEGDSPTNTATTKKRPA